MKTVKAVNFLSLYAIELHNFHQTLFNNINLKKIAIIHQSILQFQKIKDFLMCIKRKITLINPKGSKNENKILFKLMLYIQRIFLKSPD